MRNKRGEKRNIWLGGKLLAVCVGLLLLGLPLWSVALTPIEPTRTAELAVELFYEGMALPGGRFCLYRIGDIGQDGTLTRDHVYSGISISDPQSRSDWDQTAQEIAAFCAREHIEPLKTGQTDGTGRIRFGSDGTLTTGLYLAVGDDVSYQGYTYRSLPFLVALPNWNGEIRDWEYTVVARPKVERETVATPSPAPTATPKPTKPPGPVLPNTGQLWWPIPPLLLLGILLIVFGLLQRRKYPIWEQ